ncbi:MAG: hypothetical protein RMJ31_06420 [Nitrososphaerota archaeon]|nr:hypothetical protein [Nitrososphaerales archaeon]MDW8045388.1 hypothetical protein [Nitrososphaerota archaeon]
MVITLIPFEEIAAPAMVLIHLAAFSISVILWLFGMALTITIKQNIVDRETKVWIALTFLVGWVIAVIGLFTASLTYPAFRTYVDPELRAIDPFTALLFDLKIWSIVIGSLTGAGTIAIAWGMESKKEARITFILALITIIMIILSALFAVLTGVKAYI